MAKLRLEEREEENKAAARIAEKEYEIEMVLREREMAARKHEMEFFAKKHKNNLGKIPEENRKRLIDAKMREIDLMDSESLFSKSKADKESGRGSYQSMKNDDLVNEWLESADNENALTAPCKTVQTSSGQNQEHQTKSGHNQEPSSDPAQSADRDSQLPHLIQQSSFEFNETGIRYRKRKSFIPVLPIERTKREFSCWRTC